MQGSEVIYAYNTPKFVGNKFSLRYHESTFRYFRLTILNEDNPPLPIDGARAYGFLRKLIFPASSGRTYRLYYGTPLDQQTVVEDKRPLNRSGQVALNATTMSTSETGRVICSCSLRPKGAGGTLK